MIISRTPVRMSFVGGGTDWTPYYRKYGGAVVSTTINKYIYITVNKKFDKKILLNYSKTEEVENVSDIQHPLIRECIKFIGLDGGLFICSIADIPSRGTGLASSSSFTVGLLHALYAYSGKYVSAEVLASEACTIEIEKCGEPVGKQDQYAAAYGGLNFIEFRKDDSVVVSPIILNQNALREFESNCIVFYTGISRSASEVLKTQQTELKMYPSKSMVLNDIKDMAYAFRDCLQDGRLNDAANILNESWQLKRALSSTVSNSDIDGWYKTAMSCGALGGKLLGAGGGGFMLFYAPRERHTEIESALPELRRVDVSFVKHGSQIIFVHD